MTEWKITDERAAFDALIAKKLDETVFLVNADSFGHFALWRETHDMVDWVQDNPGTMQTVGFVGDRPVTVSLTWDIIGGQRVLFWYGASQIVDYRMIEAWLREHTHPPKWDGGRRIAWCDAMNFHHCLEALKEQ